MARFTKCMQGVYHNIEKINQIYVKEFTQITGKCGDKHIRTIKYFIFADEIAISEYDSKEEAEKALYFLMEKIGVVSF